ncbi:tryptophan--tRNA ligase [candidate division KSB1 bacterium]|nr:tryptophan--tRNA ligase [candidate division KSB1 bacterium]
MKKRILSGMRPTGKLHLGNYVGALENWVKLQGEYENFHLVADWHLLTTDLDTSKIKANTIDMVIDWLSAGIDPKISPIFVQSQIKQHAELFLLLSMLVTIPRLERNPTVKEQAKDLGLESNMAFGHLGYPVLQAADILIYKAHLVPVGEDQMPHVELTREIARRFNNTYGNVFIIPSGKVTDFARLPGLDGRKMSKSLGNTILLSDSPEDIEQKVKRAITDPQKIRLGDPGRPEICNVFIYHKKFNPEEIEAIEKDCRSGALGCVACKKNLAQKLAAYLAPFREKRSYYEQHIDEIHDVIAQGNAVAREVAMATMEEVYQVMNLG